MGMGQSTAKASPKPDGSTPAKSPGPYVTRIPVGAEGSFTNGEEDGSFSSPRQEYVKPDPLKLIQDIIEEVQNLEDEIKQFDGVDQDKQYKYIDEMLTRCMIRLDNIETEGKEDIRLARKRAINAVHQAVRMLETKVGRRPSVVEPDSSLDTSTSIVQYEVDQSQVQQQADLRQLQAPSPSEYQGRETPV
jgi:hypothetical protein